VQACAVTNITSLELALIPAGAALAGVVLGTAGSAYLDRRRDKRTARRDRDQAIAELLAATADLMSGAQAVRAAYHQQHAAIRHYIRVSAGVLAALGATMPGAGKFDWKGLLDWHTGGPALNRFLAIDRELDERQRTIALDLATILAPRVARFYAAVAVLTLGSDVKIANAVRDMTPAIGTLLEAIAAKERKYVRARTGTETALGTFRTIADQRRKKGL
jgi:hypothetical protein